MHDFDESLSQSKKDQYWFHSIYLNKWPDCRIEIVEDIVIQKSGIDTYIHSPTGKCLPIEEKFRPANSKYTHGKDLCLEVWSSFEGQSPGWIRKPQAAKLLVYGWGDLGVCLMLVYAQLKILYANNESAWLKKYREIRSPNKGYTTISVAVPLGEILPYVKHKWFVKGEL